MQSSFLKLEDTSKIEDEEPYRNSLMWRDLHLLAKNIWKIITLITCLKAEQILLFNIPPSVNIQETN